VPRLNPRPVGLGFGGRGFASASDKGLGWEDGADAGLDVDDCSGDRTSPASCIAACSSALVGSLIGDLVLAAKGDEDADCLPHRAVALLTEANVDFSGDDSSLAGETSTFGGAISFNAVGFGLSTVGSAVLVGAVGSGRENRDCNGAGEGDGDIGLGD
jgi:hypothetical protein